MVKLPLADLSLLEELEACLLLEGETIPLLLVPLEAKAGAGTGALALRAGTSPCPSSARTCQVSNLPRGPLSCLAGISVSHSEANIIITSIKLCI